MANYADGIAFADATGVVEFNTSSAPTMNITGAGMSIAANKIKGIRAACCSDVYTARYIRLHNDANVLCVGARVVGEGLAWDLVSAFLGEEFTGGKHARRVNQIIALEEKT